MWLAQCLCIVIPGYCNIYYRVLHDRCYFQGLGIWGKMLGVVKNCFCLISNWPSSSPPQLKSQGKKANTEWGYCVTVQFTCAAFSYSLTSTHINQSGKELPGFPLHTKKQMKHMIGLEPPKSLKRCILLWTIAVGLHTQWGILPILMGPQRHQTHTSGAQVLVGNSYTVMQPDPAHQVMARKKYTPQNTS